MSKQDLVGSENLLTASLAGATAAAVETILTYPFEFVKTQTQLTRRVNGIQYDLSSPGKVMFRGASALIAGNSLKALARYSVYNSATQFMTDSSGQVSAPQVVVAGMMTGFVESLVIVPFENIKTTMIERTLKPEILESNAKSAILGAQTVPGISRSHAVPTQPNFVQPTSSNNKSHNKPNVRPKAPRPAAAPIQLRPGQSIVPVIPVDTTIRTFFGNVKDMLQERGPRAFLQGFAPTVFRQVTYSSVQFTTYTAVKQAIHPSSNDPMPTHKWLLAGLASATAVVVATQPLDVIKTRMQSINSRVVYRSTPRTLYRIFIEEGVTTFWAGSIPRFSKIIVGSSITFMMYEKMDELIRKATTQNPFSPE